MHGKKSRILQWPQRIRLYFSTRLVPLAKHAKHRNHGYYRNASFIAHCKPASACTLCDCNCSLRKLRWRNEKKTHTDSNSLAGQSSNYLSIIPIHDFRSGHRFIWNRARNKAHFFLSTPFTMRFLSMMKTTRNFLYIQQQTPQQNERFQEIFKLCEIRRQSKVVNAFGIGWYN